MRTVAIESPYRVVCDGDTREELERHKRYLDACILDCIYRGEAPFAGHAYLPNVLCDYDPADRALGISLHIEISSGLDALVVYTDLGITDGMRAGIRAAADRKQVTEFRVLGGQWSVWL